MPVSRVGWDASLLRAPNDSTSRRADAPLATPNDGAPMRILMIAPHFAEYSYCLARAIAEHHDVLLVLKAKNFEAEMGGMDLSGAPARLRVELTPHSRSLITLARNIATYRRHFRRFRPHVVHFQEEPVDYLMGFVPMIGATPMVLTVHDPDPHFGADTARLQTRRGRYSRWLRSRADGVFVHGAALAQAAEAMPQFSGKQIAFASHGPLGIYARTPHTSDCVPGECLFFGRIESYKGLEVFIDAIALLRHRGIAATGVVAGRGGDLERHRARLVPEAGFRLIDKFLSVDEVLERFDRAQIVVLPYHEATQSGVAAYALGRGRAMVLTRVGGLPEMIDESPDRPSGIAVPPRDAPAMAAAIESLIADPARATAMGRRAAQLGRTNLSWSVAADATDRLYRKLVRRHA